MINWGGIIIYSFPPSKDGENSNFIELKNRKFIFKKK